MNKAGTPEDAGLPPLHFVSAGEVVHQVLLVIDVVDAPTNAPDTACTGSLPEVNFTP
jgi:hypothetical protein